MTDVVKPPPKQVTPDMMGQAASMLVMGKTITEVSKELQVSFYQAKKIANLPETKGMIEEIKRTTLATIKEEIKVRTAQLADKVMRVIEQQLEEGNLDAVKVSLKILGFQDAEPPQSGTQNLTVVMPPGVNIVPENKVKQPIIEVENETDKPEWS